MNYAKNYGKVLVTQEVICDRLWGIEVEQIVWDPERRMFAIYGRHPSFNTPWIEGQSTRDYELHEIAEDPD